MMPSLHLGSAQSPAAFMDPPPSRVSEVIRRLEGTRGDFAIPLWRGSLAGEFRIAAALPGGRLPTKVFDRARPPTVVILSGDPDFPEPTPPPSAFPKVARFIEWAATIVIHATGGQRDHYAAVAAAAPIVRRMLLIETATVQEDAWLSLVQAEAARKAARGQRLPWICWSATPRGGHHPVKEI